MEKQRVLIVNKFYYRRGGDCIHALALERLLAARGHEVAVLACAHPQSLPSAWNGYWPAPVDFRGSFAGRFRAARRMLGHDGTARSVRRLLRDFRPDVVHLHNIHSHLSPVVAREARAYGCRVVWTLHDYKPVCPAYTLLCRGRVCTECIGRPSAVVRNRCVQDSLAASLAARAEAVRWNTECLQRWTDVFVCPSEFLRSVMLRAGFDASRLVVIPNFCPSEFTGLPVLPPSDAEPYYCYVGRISPEKGVATLLRAAARLPYKLKIAGDGPMLQQLMSRYSAFGNIDWLGQLDGPGVAALLGGARLSVVPSEWHENCPLGVIESLCAGTPVAASGMGGIPELLAAESSASQLFPAADARALAAAVTSLWENGPSHAARHDVARRSRLRHSPGAYYDRLIRVYSPESSLLTDYNQLNRKIS